MVEWLNNVSGAGQSGLEAAHRGVKMGRAQVVQREARPVCRLSTRSGYSGPNTRFSVVLLQPRVD